MALSLTLSRLALGMALSVLLITLITPCPGRRWGFVRRLTMIVATFAVGMALFAAFFGLVAACDRI